MTYARGVALGIALGALGIVHPAASKGNKANFCAKSARAAFRACKKGALDDFWIASGRCQNESDKAARNACIDTARSERSDARDECPDQRDARLEICDRLGQAPYDPPIDPSNFLTPAEIAANPNPLFPLRPGTVWHYVGGGEVNTVTVTNDTRMILGVDTVVVHDTVEVAGEVTEDTEDYFTQDTDGNVWYFGELSKSFENGFLVDLEGSWTAGVDGGKPGIVMKAAPAVGDFYRQEFLLGDAEDVAEVKSTTGTEAVPAASCAGTCLVTHETSGLEPDASEDKYFEAGIGQILEVDLETGVRSELVEYDPGP
jgi:hypothetical protein